MGCGEKELCSWDQSDILDDIRLSPRERPLPERKQQRCSGMGLYAILNIPSDDPSIYWRDTTLPESHASAVLILPSLTRNSLLICLFSRSAQLLLVQFRSGRCSFAEKVHSLAAARVLAPACGRLDAFTVDGQRLPSVVLSHRPARPSSLTRSVDTVAEANIEESMTPWNLQNPYMAQEPIQL